jgi:hypothetical protein
VYGPAVRWNGGDVRKEAAKGNINTLSRIETKELFDIQSKERL